MKIAMTFDEAEQCELAMQAALEAYERRMPARLADVGGATGMLGALIGALVIKHGSEQALEILKSIINMVELAAHENVERGCSDQVVVLDIHEGHG